MSKELNHYLKDIKINPQFANNEPLEAALVLEDKTIADLLLQDPRVLNDMNSIIRIFDKRLKYIEKSLRFV